MPNDYKIENRKNNELDIYATAKAKPRAFNQKIKADVRQHKISKSMKSTNTYKYYITNINTNNYMQLCSGQKIDI